MWALKRDSRRDFEIVIDLDRQDDWISEKFISS